MSKSSLDSMSQARFAKVNNINLWYETFGTPEKPALLLIAGGCLQGVIWPKLFCEKLVRAGFYVIRYDHRDTGLSSGIDFSKNPYDVMDMTEDAIGILNALDLKKTHVFGFSLGALIGELLAVYFSQRIHTITLMSSTCEIHPLNLAYAGLPPDSNATFSSPTPHYLAWLKEFLKLSPQTDEEKLLHRLEGWNILNGKKIPLEEKLNREVQSEILSRLVYPQGMVNHVMMIRSERCEDLIRTAPSKIKVPTVVIHGTEDPILPPDHGAGLSHAIDGSTYYLVEGMGHVPNDHFYDFYVDILKKQMSNTI